MDSPLETIDVAIIGGGPAGLSAAFWCSELGLATLLVEKEEELGGQLLWTHNPITNYLGLDTADGRELRDRFLAHAVRAKYSRLAAEVESADLSRRTLGLSNGRELSARWIIIATGVRRRTLGVPGEIEFRGHGILESGVGEKDKVVGKRILIVGGGDAAIENAIMLSEIAPRVVVAHRRPTLTAREEFEGLVVRKKNVILLAETVVKRILGDSLVKEVEFEKVSTGDRWIEPVDIILIRIGVTPNSEFIQGLLDLDADGYIKVTNGCETTTSGIFAIGDVAHPKSPTISTATGTGATAAKTISYLLRSQTGYNTGRL
ncbi:MAG: NAD(P)/FAD-dependent oxidoreductase [Pyrinomonadaceae bacterium]